MKIKVGREYLTRNGVIVTVTRHDTEAHNYPYELHSPKRGFYTVNGEGFVLATTIPSDDDLVKRVNKGFRLEDGKSYKTRDGSAIIKVTKDSEADIKYCFYTTDIDPVRTYTKKGKWCTTMGDHDNDLVGPAIDDLVLSLGSWYLLKNGTVLKLTSLNSDSTTDFYVARGINKNGSEFGYGRNGRIYEDQPSEYDISALFEGLADIKVGSTYRNGDGTLVKIIYIKTGDSEDQPIVGIVETDNKYEIHKYELNGAYYSSESSKFDLIELVV
jgi:hypothetical protein